MLTHVNTVCFIFECKLQVIDVSEQNGIFQSLCVQSDEDRIIWFDPTDMIQKLW